MMNKYRNHIFEIVIWIIVVNFVFTINIIAITDNSENLVVKTESSLSHVQKGSQQTTSHLASRITGLATQTTRGPIIITGDTSFTAANGVRSGNGTISDPYLISNWYINGGGNCISIQNTRKYFIIENCKLIGGNTAGINLNNVTNGYVRNNICNDGIAGIRLGSNSTNNTIVGNTCDGNSFAGIYIHKCNETNIITRNFCTNSGSYGFWLDKPNNQTISANIAINNPSGIVIIAIDSGIGSNIVYHNWVWGGTESIREALGSGEPSIIFDNFFSPTNADYDMDGLTDEQEIYIGTHPAIQDTDNDHFADAYEVDYGSDPLDDTDYPTPPMVDIISPVGDVLNQNSVALEYIVSEGVATIYTNNIANMSSQPSGSFLSELTDGTYNITIVVTDILGNEDNETVLFSVDTSPPTVGISSPNTTTFEQNSVILNYTVSDGSVIVYTNGVANTTAVPSGSVITDLSDGNHTITIFAIDETGNIGSASVTFRIVTTTPETSIIFSTSVIYETLTTFVTQTKSTAEFATLAIFAGLIGIFFMRKRRRI